MIKQLSRSRMDEAPVSEFAIPHYASWDDGSEYEVFWLNAGGERWTGWAQRRYHGPKFGVEHGWHQEAFYVGKK